MASLEVKQAVTNLLRQVGDDNNRANAAIDEVCGRIADEPPGRHRSAAPNANLPPDKVAAAHKPDEVAAAHKLVWRIIADLAKDAIKGERAPG